MLFIYILSITNKKTEWYYFSTRINRISNKSNISPISKALNKGHKPILKNTYNNIFKDLHDYHFAKYFFYKFHLFYIKTI